MCYSLLFAALRGTCETTAHEDVHGSTRLVHVKVKDVCVRVGRRGNDFDDLNCERKNT